MPIQWLVDFAALGDPASFLREDMTSLVIGGMEFFHRLKENANAPLWDSCFKKFHFSVWIPKEETKPRSNDGVRHTSLLERNTGFLKDVISLGRIPPGGEYSRCLEIHGLLFPKPEKPSAPNDAPRQAEPKFNHVEVLKDALIRADHVSLIDNSSIEQISQIGDENLEAMKSLWLENCTNITHVIKIIEDVGLGQKLSSLYLWNLSSLTSMYDDSLDSEFFSGLKTLHVECCPLPKIFYLSRLPENLEAIQVKFCLKMTDIFDLSNESAECKESAECNLRKLHLVELPELVRIGISMPHLKELKLRGCPGVEDLGKVLGKAEYLEILHISDVAMLESISSGQESVGFQNLVDQDRVLPQAHMYFLLACAS